MPYRIDILNPPDDVLDRLVHLGALDVEQTRDGVAAILADAIPPDALGIPDVRVSPAIGRDDGSVWLLSSGSIRISGIELRLADSTAFGTGHHPTTALCLDALEETVTPHSLLDVGTGSGVLALAGLILGVPRAVGLDIDADALKIAEENARLNNLSHRFQLVLGEPHAVHEFFPLVLANVLAAPLIDMAPVLVRRVAGRGRLILSGIPLSLETEVRAAYQRLGMRHVRSGIRSGWAVVILQASW